MLKRLICFAVMLWIAIAAVWWAVRYHKSDSAGPDPGPAAADSSPTLRETVLNTIPGVSATRTYSDAVGNILDRLAPIDDEWDTEVFSGLATKQLKQLATLLEHPRDLGPNKVMSVISPAYQSRPLRADNLVVTLSDSETRVLRQVADSGDAESTTGAMGFVAAAKSLLSTDRPESMTVEFKLFRVSPPSEKLCETIVLFQSGQVDTKLTVQQNATWKVQWEVATAQLPRIRSIHVLELEEVHSSRNIRFRDVTAAVFRNSPSFRQQLNLGVDHWRGRLESHYGVDPNGIQGIAIGDVNGDGWEDLFVCQQGGLPNRLYLQQHDGSLKDVSAEAGVDWMEVCRSALLVDLDNDGDQDLVMAQGWYLMIMANDGAGKFTVVLQTKSEANLHSACAADYDNDGDLDVFFCGRNPARERDRSEGILGTPIPYHDANNGGPNILLRNDGQLRFSDVTVAVGLDQNNRRYSYAASWEDFDNDGDLDLYVANDFGRNNLYENNESANGERRFRDVAEELAVEDLSAGMSITWGDYNNDGRMDAYVSNMFSSAGNRIAYQRQFRSDASDDELREFRRHARGNTLFENSRSFQFQDVSEFAGVTMGRWAWGAKFCDVNNDGWEDLYVANGFITTEDTGDL